MDQNRVRDPQLWIRNCFRTNLELKDRSKNIKEDPEPKPIVGRPESGVLVLIPFGRNHNKDLVILHLTVPVKVET